MPQNASCFWWVHEGKTWHGPGTLRLLLWAKGSFNSTSSANARNATNIPWCPCRSTCRRSPTSSFYSPGTTYLLLKNLQFFWDKSDVHRSKKGIINHYIQKYYRCYQNVLQFTLNSEQLHLTDRWRDKPRDKKIGDCCIVSFCSQYLTFCSNFFRSAFESACM